MSTAIMQGVIKVGWVASRKRSVFVSATAHPTACYTNTSNSVEPILLLLLERESSRMSSFFQALSSYFAPSKDRSHSSRNRQQALSSTRDAFSLPQQSPSLRHSTSRESSTDFRYPPPQNTYDHVPPFTPGNNVGRQASVYSDPMFANDAVSPISAGKRPSHLLPLHRDSISSLPSYPPLKRTWARLNAWLSNEYTELGDTLNYGCLPETIAQVEAYLGFPLPQAVRESYLIVDGQEPESSLGSVEGLFFGLVFLSLEDVLAEWTFWRDVDEDPDTGANERLREHMRSVPPNWVRREYSCRGWLPLMSDHMGNYLGVDLDPGEAGTPGQVIVFGRDFDTKVVMRRGEGAAGWATWLAALVEDLENGDGFELAGQGDGGSEGSEDDVGYESYFFNASGGSKGRGGRDGGQGLRLAGEYKGWNVLEAWADKSMRSWSEAGLGLEAIDERPDETSQPSHGLGVFGLRSGNGAEVAIPVLAENEAPEMPDFDDTRSPNSAQSRYGSYPGHAYFEATSMPTISVTMPPPLPLELPTKSDLLPTVFPPLLEQANAEAGHSMNKVQQIDASDDPVVQSDDDELSKATLLPLPVSSTASPAVSIAPSPLPSPLPQTFSQTRGDSSSSSSVLAPVQMRDRG